MVPSGGEKTAAGRAYLGWGGQTAYPKEPTVPIIYSQKLEEILKTRDPDSDASCTNGFDNDGSTGQEIFENGFDLAVRAAKEGKSVFAATVDDEVTHFVLAQDEDEACRIAEAWEPREENNENEEDS